MKGKRWIIYIVLSCAVLFGAFWLLRSQWQQHTRRLDIMQAVPLDVLYLCYFEQAGILNDVFTNTASGWQRFVSPNSLFLYWLQELKTVAKTNSIAGEVLQSDLIYSAHPKGKNTISSLYAFAMPPVGTDDKWEVLLQIGGRPVHEQSYHGTFIKTIGSGDTLMYAALVDRLALFSDSQLLLQNAVRHVRSNTSLHDNEQFQEILRTSGAYTDIRFFINHRAINAFFTAAGSEKWRKYMSIIPYMADWTALDGVISPQVIHLNGFVFPSFTDNNYLALLPAQDGGENTLWALLPETVAIALNIGFSDVDRFLNGYKYFLDRHKILTPYRNNLVTLGEEYNQNVNDLFSALFVKEIGLAYIPDKPAGWVSMIKTANPKFVIEQLKGIADDRQRLWKIDPKSSVGLYHNPARGLLAGLFGEAFNRDDSYFTIKDNWVIFGGNRELLAAFHQPRTPFKKYLQGTQASSYCSGNSLLSLFVQPDATNNAEILSYLHPAWQGLWAKALQNDRFKIAGVQMRPSGDKLYTTFFSVYDMTGKPKPPASVATPAEPVARTSSAPEPTATTDRTAQRSFPVINHNTKATEYLTQDSDHIITLVDGKNKKTLWSQKIDGAIQDSVYQIDFYKNGKLQMLFITASKVYLIDRNGNPVALYPLTLPSPARYLSVFDYNKDYDYRVFIGFANRTVRAYDKKGLAVEGWKTYTAPATLTRAPAFFRINGRDYIMMCDETATCFLDRRGNIRLTPKPSVVVKPHTPVKEQQQPPTLQVTTSAGKTVAINMNTGEVNGG
ncbi:MAG: hypothetical protein LBD91_07565 [Prevotellaceae bacterium]|jgi:hypothetical protein|nr:hypothetical protein [Prevotellaceae bacterium]